MFAGPVEFSFFFLSRFLLFPCLFAFCTAFFFSVRQSSHSGLESHSGYNHVERTVGTRKWNCSVQGPRDKQAVWRETNFKLGLPLYIIWRKWNSCLRDQTVAIAHATWYSEVHLQPNSWSAPLTSQQFRLQLCPGLHANMGSVGLGRQNTRLRISPAAFGMSKVWKQGVAQERYYFVPR